MNGKMVAVIAVFMLLIAAVNSAFAADLLNEGFESGAIPAEWDVFDDNGMDLISTENPYQGTYCIEIDYSTDYIVTPQMSTPGNLTFMVMVTGETDIDVLVSNDGATWELIAEHIAITCNGVHQQATVDLSSYSDVYVKIIRGGSAHHHIDNIVITDRTGSGSDPTDSDLVIDETANIGIQASVAGVTSLSVEDQYADGSIDFGTLTDTYQKAPEYIKIVPSSNYGGWSVQIYTDNFPATTPSTSTWGFAYGGLVDLPNEKKIALGWCAFDGATGGDPAADPSAANRWSYVKDKSDIDDPNTPTAEELALDPDKVSDESWSDGGYANVAWGVANSVAYVVNPNNPTGSPMYTDTMTNGDVYVYLETASAAVPGTYSTTVYFDLLHE